MHGCAGVMKSSAGCGVEPRLVVHDLEPDVPMTARVFTAGLCAAVSGLSLSACGSGPPADQRAVIDAVHAFHRDVADGRYESACRRVTGRVVTELRRGLDRPGADCSELMNDLWLEFSPAQWEALVHVKVRKATIRGRHAEIADADVELPSILHPETVDGNPTLLVWVDGGWKLEHLD